jgi:hypothetical protein
MLSILILVKRLSVAVFYAVAFPSFLLEDDHLVSFLIGREPWPQPLALSNTGVPTLKPDRRCRSAVTWSKRDAVAIGGF